jgi:hypothetical protein
MPAALLCSIGFVLVESLSGDDMAMEFRLLWIVCGLLFTLFACRSLLSLWQSSHLISRGIIHIMKPKWNLHNTVATTWESTVGIHKEK